jgi:hypothetical protein
MVFLSLLVSMLWAVKSVSLLCRYIITLPNDMTLYDTVCLLLFQVAYEYSNSVESTKESNEWVLQTKNISSTKRYLIAKKNII